MVTALLRDHGGSDEGAVIASKFHNGLAEAAVEVARRIGENRVVLSGGCFQNRYLTERVVHRLREEGFRPYWHQACSAERRRNCSRPDRCRGRTDAEKQRCIRRGRGGRPDPRESPTNRREGYMCLAIPGKVLDIDRSGSPVMGTVSFGGTQKKVCLEWLSGSPCR